MDKTEWLWEVWTQHGYVMGTGSLTTAVRRAYCAVEKGDGAVIKSVTGRIIPITERRSDRPGAAQPMGTWDGVRHHAIRRGRDSHPVYGPDALKIEAP